MAEFLRIAHRGAPRRALENTLESFRLARVAGAVCFELDVWLSADGVPMVFHDPTLSRLSCRRERVSEMTASDLTRVPLIGGYTIPTLSSVVGLLAESDARVYVELKDTNPNIAPSCALECSGAPGEWVFSSFHHPHLAMIKGRFPTQALVDRTFVGRLSKLPGDEIGVSDGMATPRLFEKLRPTLKPITVYTVNDSNRAEELKRLGASGVFTDTW